MAGGAPFHDEAWRRACNNGNCVEVAFEDERVGVRDGKRAHDGPVLAFTPDEWRMFVEAVKRGEFDLPGSVGLASSG